MVVKQYKIDLERPALAAETEKVFIIMYAIVDIAGQQFKVQAGSELFCHRLPAAKDAEVSFDKVLLVEDEAGVKVGSPYVEGAAVKAVVISDDVRADKVLVFKKIRRKGFQKCNGHRQKLSKIRIEQINIA